MNEALKACPMDDSARSFSDSLLPDYMIEAGAAVLEQAALDLQNYVVGETVDWDYGMEAVAVYRAMTEAWNQRATPSATAMQQALETLRWIATPRDESMTFGSCSMWCAREARAKARAAIPALEAAMQPSEVEVERPDPDTLGPFEFYVTVHENYSGEHREWNKKYALPSGAQLTRDIVKAYEAAIAAMGEG